MEPTVGMTKRPISYYHDSSWKPAAFCWISFYSDWATLIAKVQVNAHGDRPAVPVYASHFEVTES